MADLVAEWLCANQAEQNLVSMACSQGSQGSQGSQWPLPRAQALAPDQKVSRLLVLVPAAIAPGAASGQMGRAAQPGRTLNGHTAYSAHPPPGYHLQASQADRADFPWTVA
eukprot:CAMPEP_0170572226 /NCGR_PEP_ID=MMETSP0224-20130122/2096_1 /TAXON_ID=285029 /ORGANISM="Togula jolla, Strain CCCM 725" /LENGTH=110 /DNA_ID=CAMNT_0010894687 /DNA_START=1809 /DNA_END=2141 /DNA_ORIENTATION=-